MLVFKRTCSKSKSQNSVPQCFATKLIRQKWLHLEITNVVVWTNIRYYQHSDISSLGNFNAMFLSLLHAQLTLYSTSDNQGFRETSQFTVVIRSSSTHQTNRNLTVISVLPSYLLSVFVIVKLNSPTMWWLPFWIESNHLFVQKNELFNRQQWDWQHRNFEHNIYVLAVRSTDFIHYQGCQKTCQFTTVVWPPSRWQTNWKFLVFLFSNITFA